MDRFTRIGVFVTAVHEANRRACDVQCDAVALKLGVAMQICIRR